MGTEQFGFCSFAFAGSGLTFVAPYNNVNCSTTTQSAGTATPGGVGTVQFGFNTTNTLSTYSDIFVNKTTGATPTGDIALLGNIASSTKAGVYTTTLTFIATGVY